MGNTMSNANSMSNNSRVSNSMSNWVGNNSWVSNSMNNWAGNSMSNWVSNNSRVSNSMGNRMSNSVGICSNTIIRDISNITIIIIGMIVDMLGTAIRKVDRVGTFYNTSTIIGLSLVEGSTRVVISNSISISVDSWAIISRLRVSNWVNNGSMVDRGRVNNRCRHVDGCWGVVDRGRGMVGRGGSMIRLGSVIRLGSMVDYRSMVGLRCVRKGGRSVDPNNGLLVA